MTPLERHLLDGYVAARELFRDEPTEANLTRFRLREDDLAASIGEAGALEAPLRTYAVAWDGDFGRFRVTSRARKFARDDPWRAAS